MAQLRGNHRANTSAAIDRAYDELSWARINHEIAIADYAVSIYIDDVMVRAKRLGLEREARLLLEPHAPPSRGYHGREKVQ